MTRWLAPVDTVIIVLLDDEPTVPVTVALVPLASVYVNVALSVSAGTTTAVAGFSVPAVDGLTARATDVPPAAAGMLSVAVSVTAPFGATAAVIGDSVTAVGVSAAPSTRTCAVITVVPSVAVSVTSGFCETPSTT